MFELFESFNIDNGELDSISQQECFVLGYELAMITTKCELVKEPFTALVHSSNIDRVKAALNKRERSHKFVWPTDDSSESWVNVIVQGVC